MSTPQGASSWGEECVVQFVAKYPDLCSVVTHMCRFGMVAADDQGHAGPVFKPTRWLTNSPMLAKELSQYTCLRNHRHVHLLGGRASGAAVYPPRLCAAVARGIGDQLRQALQSLNQCSLDQVKRSGPSGSDYHGPVQQCSTSRKGPAKSAERDLRLVAESMNLELMDEELLSLGSLGPVVEDEMEELEMDEAVAYDDVKGGELDAKKVHEARQSELRYLWARGVYGYASRRNAMARGIRPVKLKWIDTNKGDATHPNLRSRLVAMEIRRKGVEPIFSATPPLEALRCLVALAARESPGNPQPLRLYLADVSRAHFYAESQREVYVELPREDPRSQDPDAVGLLHRTMYGTLDAAEQWSRHYSERLCQGGFIQGKANPCLFFHPGHGLSLLVHGDDFIAVGRPELNYYGRTMRSQRRLWAPVPMNRRLPECWDA